MMDNWVWLPRNHKYLSQMVQVLIPRFTALELAQAPAKHPPEKPRPQFPPITGSIYRGSIETFRFGVSCVGPFLT